VLDADSVICAALRRGLQSGETQGRYACVLSLLGFRGRGGYGDSRRVWGVRRTRPNIDG